MSYDAITIAAVCILSLSPVSRAELVGILNKNLPAVGGGTIQEFHKRHVRDIVHFVRENQRPFVEYLEGFDENDPNIDKAARFLDEGGLNRLFHFPGAVPNRPVCYDALYDTLYSIVNAAGGKVPDLPRTGSFVRTRDT